tara:strand:+ start:155 stop:1003 length:849 start_codon:yes stop_codon:yes gene_type:complete
MEIVTKIAPIALALIMLSLGLGLTKDDFYELIKKPKNFITGFIFQVVLLPIVAFIILLIFNLPIELAIGIMIIAAAPGGVTSNILTKFANGDVALSISLTAVISLLSIFTVPFIILGSAKILNFTDFNSNFSINSIALKMFFVVTLPVILGMIIRKFFNSYILKNNSLIQKISVFLFLFVFAAIWIEEWNNILIYITSAGAVSLILNISMMIIGYYFAKFFVSGVAQRKCISLECGLQNGTLAVFVATQIFDDTIYIYPTAAYALIMFVTSILFVFIVKNKA